VEMRHGWLELSTWNSCIDKMVKFFESSDDTDHEFESFMVRDKELNDRWSTLIQLVDQREVPVLLTSSLCLSVNHCHHHCHSLSLCHV